MLGGFECGFKSIFPLFGFLIHCLELWQVPYWVSHHDIKVTFGDCSLCVKIDGLLDMERNYWGEGGLNKHMIRKVFSRKGNWHQTELHSGCRL
jgi:hypothetical protein